MYTWNFIKTSQNFEDNLIQNFTYLHTDVVKSFQQEEKNKNGRSDSLFSGPDSESHLTSPH